MEISAREMEINGGNPSRCPIYEIDAGMSPVVAGNHCVVQLLSIPRKFVDQLHEDTAQLRDVLHQTQSSTGAVIKVVDREATRMPTGQHYTQQKARKEFYFQIEGSAAQVERAKEELERFIENAENRVSLKMDVSFSDHSFIIGRFGRGIQNVSLETNCLIHFPDSNKNKQYEKSNQVSISGPAEGVLEARRRIRKLLPISFAFVISDVHHNDAMWQVAPQKFDVRPRVQDMINILQNEHRITISMLPMHSLQSSAALVTVRGRHANIDRIKDGILKLMAFLVPDNPQLSVYVGIEVSPHHLDFVTGPSGIKLIELMRETNTTIEIPDIPDRRQSIPTVRIVGQVLNVYEAWVKFMDLLPLALLVQIPADASPVPLPTSDTAWSTGEDSPLTEDPAFAAATFGHSRIDDIAQSLNEILEPYDITLMSRQKSRDVRETTRQWWLVIKGPEKYVDIMFEIHKALKKDDPVAHVQDFIQEIPSPARYSRYSFRPSRINAAPSSSSVDLCFRPGTTGLANAWSAPSAPTYLNSRQPPAWPQGAQSPSSMTSTPIKLTRPPNSQAESPTTPLSYWKALPEAWPPSFINALEESMDSMRLGVRRSSASGCVDRESFASNNTNNTGYSGFRAPPSRPGPGLGAHSTMSASSDQACCSGLSSLSLFDDDILRDCLNNMSTPANVVSDLGPCAGSNNNSFDPTGYGNAPFSNSSETFFANSKRPPFKDHPRHSLLSGYGTESDLASRSTKSVSFDLDSTSPMPSNLGASDSGFVTLKDGFGELDFDSIFHKSATQSAADSSRYNLWGQNSPRGKKFDAAPGSGRETHS